MKQTSPKPSKLLEKLENYLSRISYCLRTNETNSEVLQNLLISINYFLKDTDLTVKVNLSHTLLHENPLTSLCPECKTFQYNIPLPCGHSFCRSCLKVHLLAQTSGNLSTSIACPSCFSELPQTFRYKVFGIPQVMRIQRERGVVSEVSTFRCEVCLETVPVENGITLECDHRFCNKCLEMHMTELINENRVGDSEFCCPKCGGVINAEVVQGNLSKELNMKYLDFRTNHFKPDSEESVFKKCPFCPALMEISIFLKEIQCRGCKKIYCPQCNELHTGKKCRNKEIAESKVEGSENKKCPKCGEGIEKCEGCNFVECPWPACHKTFFCYICLKTLTRIQHYTHYTNSGPYGNTCNTLDGIRD